MLQVIKKIENESEIFLCDEYCYRLPIPFSFLNLCKLFFFLLYAINQSFQTKLLLSDTH